jgi:hypothetical protein
MPPQTPRPSYQRKSVKRVKILKLKRSSQKSLFAEYFYPILGILFCLLSGFLMAAGMTFYEATVVGLWVVAILFFIRQIVRYRKGEPAPKKEPKAKPEAQQPEKDTPPALPRVSKDFSPIPPKGDKRYPPPSPFIKPPK